MLVLALYVAVAAHARPQPTGDEPHYLLIAISVVTDGDLDLRDEYADPAALARAYPSGGLLEPETHAAVYTPGGPLRPVHNVGLPLVLAPLVALDQGWFAARLLMALLAAAVAPLVLLLLHVLLPDRPRTATVAVLTVAATAPVLPFSNQIYPEVPGALLLATAVVCLTALRRWRGAALAAATAAALLPWFHVRFALFSVALVAALLVQQLRPRGSGGADRRGVVAVLLPPVVSAVGVLVSNAVLFGSPAPNAAYRSPPFPTQVSARVEHLYEWTLGDVLGRTTGVAPLAPVVLLSLVGLVLVVVRWPRWGGAAVGAGGLYYVVASVLGLSGGYCPPGRWLVVVAPLLAVPLALALSTGRRAVTAFVVLAGWSLVLSVVMVQDYRSLYIGGREEVVLPVAERVDGIWPVLGRSLADEYEQRAVDMPRAVGTSEDGVQTSRPADGPGALFFGPGVVLQEGTYTAYADLEVDAAPGTTAAVLELVEDGRVLASAPVTATASSGPVRVRLAPARTTGRPLEVRAFVTGEAVVSARDVGIEPAAEDAVPPLPWSAHLPHVLLWTLVTAGLLALCRPLRRPV